MNDGFSAGELASACRGVWRNGEPQGTFRRILTDSRKIEKGCLFLALKGERFDGHAFLAKAAEAGAAAVISQQDLALDYPLLLVKDTLQAYQDLARYHRRKQSDLICAAVTGSVGKTSVKEMLRAIFRTAYGDDAVLATEGNTNNQVGVPQNLLQLHSGIRAAVIEMGTSSPGEIAPLSRMAEPDVAIVNSIAACHLEKLKNLSGVAREKAAIFSCAKKAAVFPCDIEESAILRAAAEAAHLEQHPFGEKDEAEVKSIYEGGSLQGSRFKLVMAGREYPVQWNLTGRYQARNASAAAAAALSLAITPEKIAEGLSHTVLPGMRMKITVANDVTYANDAYNANPASMTACLRHFAEFAAQDKLLLVLGDMLELGTQEASEHEAVLKLARRLFPRTRILAVGQRMTQAAQSLFPDNELLCAPDAESAQMLLVPSVRPGDLVLLKASRGIALERALPKEAQA